MLFIFDIIPYLIKPLCITNLSLSTTLQTPCTCPEDFIPALTTWAGYFHHFLSPTGGFAHFTGALSSHPQMPSMPPQVSDTHCSHFCVDTFLSLLQHLVLVYCSNGSTFPFPSFCLPLPTPATLEDWILLDQQQGRGYLWFLKGLGVFLELTAPGLHFHWYKWFIKQWSFIQFSLLILLSYPHRFVRGQRWPRKCLIRPKSFLPPQYFFFFSCWIVSSLFSRH